MEQLAAVKARDSSISTVFYMNTVLDWHFYGMHEQMLGHPEYWLRITEGLKGAGSPVYAPGDKHFNPPKKGMLVFDHAKPHVRRFWSGVCLKAVATGSVDGCFSDSSEPDTHGISHHLNSSYLSLIHI